MDHGRVVGVERDARGRAVVLVLATGVKVAATEGYWTIYTNPRAFYVQLADSERRVYVDVVSPTVLDGPYFRIRPGDTNVARDHSLDLLG